MTNPPQFPAVSVVLPAYRLGDTIAANVAAVAAAVPGAQIVVVDDGSDDDTYAEALRAAATLTRTLVVRHHENQGKGAALRTGTGSAQGSTVVFLDGDLDLPPAQLPGL
ncbi:MAG: glycosyltransferase [Acidimicrobiia bacterium]